MNQVRVYRRGDTIFVADLGAKHVPNRFLVPEWHFETLLHKRQRGVSNKLET